MAFLKSKSSKIWFSIAALAIVLLVWKIMHKKDTTLKVATEKAVLRDITETVDEAGKLYPINEVKVSADAGSLIDEIYIQEGDTVKTGEVIAVVKTDQTSMVSGGGNSMQGLQKAMGSGMNPAAIAQAMQQAAQPATPTIKRQTKVTTIYAPMNGVVSNVSVKKGERLMGTEIARIASINEWEVRADIGEIDIVKINEGDKVKINIEALGDKDLSGKVYRIANNTGGSPMAAMGGGMLADISSYKVFIKLDPIAITALKDSLSGKQYTLRMGMNAAIKIETAHRNQVLSIPIKAVTTRYAQESKEPNSETNTKQKKETVIFVVNGTTVKKKVVQIGIQDIDYIEIISGITKEETIVVDPFEAIDKLLIDGQKVKVVDGKTIFAK
jgi:HlyD family secretion protein